MLMVDQEIYYVINNSGTWTAHEDKKKMNTSYGTCKFRLDWCWPLLQ